MALAALKDPRTGLTAVTAREEINHLVATYQALPEDINALKGNQSGSLILQQCSNIGGS